jgi:hypothetical protein
VFAKAPADPTAAFYFSNDASILLQGDGLAAFVEPITSPFAGLSRYGDGECGVVAKVWALPTESGDAIMGTASTQDHRCAAFPRKIRVTFAFINTNGTVTADGSETVQGFMNLHQLEKAAANGNPAIYIPVGDTQLRGLSLSDDNGRCGGSAGNVGLAFRPVLKIGTLAGADDVQVHRDAADTWTITSQPDEIDGGTGQTIHHDKAYCVNNATLYHMPVRFSIKTSRALTP